MYPTYYVVNCKQSITLRTSPSTSASEICQIPLGSAVSYISTASNGFYFISYIFHISLWSAYRTSQEINGKFYVNNRKAEIRTGKILQVLILCSAKRKYQKKDKSYQRDRKQKFISKISPHGNWLIFFRDRSGVR